MRRAQVDKFINDYCADNGIKLLIDPSISKNDGCCYVDLKEINLSQKYSSASVKLAVFLHEVAHIKVERFKSQPYNRFECEYYSWFEAMKLHKKLFGRAFSKSQAEFMLKCLKTYCRSHYEFRKTAHEKDAEEKKEENT